MPTATTEDFDHLQVEISGPTTHVWARQVTFQCEHAWSPPVNIYQLTDRIEICVDLAGVSVDSVTVSAAPGRLHITGRRSTPDPRGDADEPMRIVSMEIDHGRFARTITLPDHIDLTQATKEYDDGLLWIRLPIRGRH